MSFVTRLTPAAAAALFLVSCGGGGSSNPPAPVVVPSSGYAVDGYLSGAAVLCDSNGNGAADSGELSVTTDATGAFSFASGCSAALVVRGGVNVDTGILFTGLLKAPAGSIVVTPLTTLLSSGLTQVQVKAALGLPGSIDLQAVDPALKTAGVLVNAELYKKSLAVQQLLQKTTELLAGLGGVSSDGTKQLVYGEVAAAFASVLQGGAVMASGTTLDLAVVAGLVKAATLRVGGAPLVGTEIKTALSKINADSLAQVTAASLKSQGEALLKASDAQLTATTKTQQNDAAITNFVVANVAGLAGAPSAQTAALAATLTAAVTGIPVPPTNYLALVGDAISLVNGPANGAASTAYTMAEFQSAAGITVAWPMVDGMLLKVNLAEVGTYAIPADQKLSAAVSIIETSADGKGQMQGYIENVSVTRTAGGLQITVPTNASAMVYGVSGDGKKSAIIDFSNSVAGITNTLVSTAASSNLIVLGSVINFAVNKVGSDFSGIAALRGKYKVTVVINGVPLRKVDGSLLPGMTITVPTAINSSGAATTTKSVSGYGLTGYITLVN